MTTTHCIIYDLHENSTTVIMMKHLTGDIATTIQKYRKYRVLSYKTKGFFRQSVILKIDTSVNTTN